MNRVTMKTSTIFVSGKGGTQVYRSLKEVPPRLRKKLLESTSGANSGTILIADRSGRDEIVRAVQGLPSDVQTRVASKVARRAQRMTTRHVAKIRQIWPEVLLLVLLAAVIWVVFTIR
jgi:hypothetical protein